MITHLFDDLRVRALGSTDGRLLRISVANEAVVPVRSRADLERRLAADRRIFAVLAGDGEPMGFIHVALGDGLPPSLEHILAGPPGPDRPRFATFYSITRVSPRARGQAGRFIHETARALGRELPSLTHFATLSPVPGFRSWLELELLVRGYADAVVEIETMARGQGAGFPVSDGAFALAGLVRAYLATRDERGRIADPVARFHLGNGAAVREVRLGGDCSWNGLRRSFGAMVSYQYRPGLPAPSNGAPSVDALLDRLLSARHAA